MLYNKETILASLSPDALFRNITLYDVTDSTNTRLKESIAVGDAGHGDVMIAGRQTAGRGRRGRSFYSGEGGLYLSAALEPGISPEELTILTPAAAVAVCRTADAIFPGSDTAIKWVNDVQYNRLKVCGILTECVFRGGEAYAVIGIGVNLFAPEEGFPEELAGIAGSLCRGSISSVGKTEAARIANAFAARLLRELEEVCRHVMAGILSFREEYISRCVTLGRKVDVHPAAGSGVSFTGIAAGLDDRLRLIVRLPDGSETAVGAGEATLHGSGRE